MAFARPSDTALYADDDAGHGRRRRRVFLLASLPVLALGLVYTVAQRPLYDSTATVLMSAPTAIDQQMLDADVQGVAIQRRTLTGSEITTAVSQELAEAYGLVLAPLDVRKLLHVEPIPETNLLELSARGRDRALLPPLVETWIEVYGGIRARDIEERKQRTLTEVDDELEGLAARLETARAALENYRAENEIISMERQENEVLARLDGLNKALNNAIEEEVKAKAYLDTLRRSLDSGQQVVPETERSEVAAMAEELAELRTRLAELRARYTEDYIRKDPRLREIPEQIVELEGKLGAAYSEGSRAELANAERAYRTARESVMDLERRLDEHKQGVAAFNTIYATHEALVEDLARLEELNRETQARRVQIEVRQLEKYPQISVIDWPDSEAVRVGPPYLLLLGGTLLASLAAGIFAVWLHGFLNPRREQPAFVTLSGVHMYPQDPAMALEQGAAAARLAAADARRLARPAEPEDDGGDSGAAADQGSGDSSDPRNSA